MVMTFQNKDVTAHCGKVTTSGKNLCTESHSFWHRVLSEMAWLILTLDVRTEACTYACSVCMEAIRILKLLSVEDGVMVCGVE